MSDRAGDGPGEPTFLVLLAIHEDLLERFHRHQDALVERDFAAARARLAGFRDGLERHIEAEDELFAAVFAHTDTVAGAPIDLFTGEHKHFRELLAQFTRLAAELDVADPKVSRRVVELLDEEALFKSFFRHHDERERNLLYPALDRRADGIRRRELLRRFHERQGPV
jgi:hemerythrin-like domain-containing protein